MDRLNGPTRVDRRRAAVEQLDVTLAGRHQGVHGAPIRWERDRAACSRPAFTLICKATTTSRPANNTADRAATKLQLGQSTLSESVRRLERELGTPLFTRTTRHVALTSAGEELLIRVKAILNDVSSAAAAIRRIGDGAAGTVRVGITPPVAPVLAPHLQDGAALSLPGVDLDVRRL